MISGVFGLLIGVGAYYVLMSIGMDTASVMSSTNVRL
jgi:hypothetical protein